MFDFSHTGDSFKGTNTQRRISNEYSILMWRAFTGQNSGCRLKSESIKKKKKSNDNQQKAITSLTMKMRTFMSKNEDF